MHYKTRLVRFYQVHNPDKLTQVDAILDRYRGREADLMLDLHRQYKAPLACALPCLRRGPLESGLGSRAALTRLVSLTQMMTSST